MSTHHDTIVIGAGLAGLAVARTLQSGGRDVLLIESSDRVGGRVTSDEVDGFILDRGFQVINPSYPEVIALRLLEDLEFCPITPAIRISQESGDLLVGDPRNSLKFLPGLLRGATGSISEKVAFLNFLRTKQSLHKSFGASSLKFPGFAADTLNPFLQGVTLCDPAVVSAEVIRETLGYFIKAIPGVPRYGVKKFSEKLAAPVQNIHLNEVVQRVDGTKVQTSTNEYSADHVVVATDLTTATQLLDLTDSPRACESTTWYHSTNTSLDRDDYLVVDRKAPVANSIVISRVSRAYAPIDTHLIATTTISPVSESEVRRWLAKLWSADTRSWNLVASYQIKQSLPLHTDYPREDFKVRENTYVIGDHRAMPSQQGALSSGRKVAEAIIRSTPLKH
ncbi:MAG: NAD(P)/FAD-dependent oxidoreductase [Actinomycetes bacterium]